MRILVVNAGSSSLKLRVLDEHDGVAASADLPPGDDGALDAFAAAAGAVDAVGHRVVHGGTDLVEATVVDGAVIAELERLAPLAPLHQEAAIAGIRAVCRLLPGTPAVACFDTAFHATIPPASSTYALPEEWRRRFGLRRFGFHGLSHAYAARRTPEVLGRPVAGLVTCHLGAGSSVSAIVDGRCVDTTMGFTPNEGVPMATRSGSVDVGMLLWLLGNGLDQAELDDGLQHRSGLLGLAGTSDMRAIEAGAAAGDDRAAQALDVWALRVAQAVAAMAVSAGGLDALTFTGGIGERSVLARARVAGHLGWLGVAVDEGPPAADDDCGGLGDRDVTAAGGAVPVLVVHAREDLEIARQVRARLR